MERLINLYMAKAQKFEEAAAKLETPPVKKGRLWIFLHAALVATALGSRENPRRSRALVRLCRSRTGVWTIRSSLVAYRLPA